MNFHLVNKLISVQLWPFFFLLQWWLICLSCVKCYFYLVFTCTVCVWCLHVENYQIFFFFFHHFSIWLNHIWREYCWVVVVVVLNLKQKQTKKILHTRWVTHTPVLFFALNYFHLEIRWWQKEKFFVNLILAIILFHFF